MAKINPSRRRKPPTDRPGEPNAYRTELGRKLAALRAQIVASGVPLLDWEGVRREVAANRSGYADADDQTDLC